ncbi:hypothetical protein C8R43DRAFT_1238208 [Mycena crocata]|nr:hypothetical protein C8R43DRAFT_1238208 [Mycena crocata]
MVTDYPADEAALSALLMPCNDHDPHFSFTSCPHSSSHGFVCTTTEAHENEDAGKHSVYPSPPPTTSQPKRNVPLPAAPRQQQYFGGILDSPVVLMSAPAQTPLSPPPTIPTPTHALPPSDGQISPDAPFSSLLQPIPEHDSPQQLLSPISPEWTTNRKHEDELFDGDECVLMSQPNKGAYDYPFSSDADHDILGGVASFGRPALRHLDIPMYHDPDAQGVLLGFSGVPNTMEEMSPFEFSPISSSSFGSLSESDLDDLDLGGPSSYNSPSLRSFASLPSPDLDDLDLDMDLAPGIMSPSPSRRCITSLPSFDESEYLPLSCATGASDQAKLPEPQDISMSPPHSPPSPLTPHANSLLLELPPPEPKPTKTPSILDTLSPTQLASMLPTGYPSAELDALLDVRRRAGITLAALSCGTSAFPSSPSLGLDHELRRNVPRDSGEPRRRRKRAKELGREVDALVGLALGLLPTPTSDPSASAAAAAAPQEVDVPTLFPTPPASASASGSGAGYFDAVDAELPKDASDEAAPAKAKAKVKSDKAGLAGIASMPQLVARMILRRRERCVRGLAEGGGNVRGRGVSPLRDAWFAEDEPPPPEGPLPASMDVDVHDGAGLDVQVCTCISISG